MVAKPIGFLISLCLVVSCGGDTQTAPTRDFITLDSIIPAAGTALVAGERVTFTADVTATIASADGGFTALILQDQRNLSLLEFNEQPPEVTLRKGTAKVTLSHTITVPASGHTVNALFPLFVNGSNATRAVVVRSYTVR